MLIEFNMKRSTREQLFIALYFSLANIVPASLEKGVSITTGSWWNSIVVLIRFKEGSLGVEVPFTLVIDLAEKRPRTTRGA